MDVRAARRLTYGMQPAPTQLRLEFVHGTKIRLGFAQPWREPSLVRSQGLDTNQIRHKAVPGVRAPLSRYH